MKKCVVILLASLLLSGCAVQTFETLGGISHDSPTDAAMLQVMVELPEEAIKPVFSSQQETIYECNDYTLGLYTYTAGDLSATIKSLSGYDARHLTVLETAADGKKRYDWVWTAVGEDGDMICRAAILDDGNYHYCMCVSAQSEDAGSLTEQWNNLFGSFRIGD